MDSNLILYMNKLYQIANKFHGSKMLELPQIAVVGEQSAGKSSLLQAFIGKEFLPCGSDKVTRRPIQLQLTRLEREDAQFRNVPFEYAVFPEESDRKFTDFNQVKQKLLDLMKDVTRTEVVRDETIVLEIYSPHVVNLTVFDLPGLVVTNAQDEPAEAPNMIRDMVKRHIKEPNVIILCVVAGNTDLVTSTAVKLAEETDPNGDRTVLAVTMLDLVTTEDAVDKTVFLLGGKTKTYKEGIVGVINRKPDAANRRTIADVRGAELKLLQEKFQPVASQKGLGSLKLGSELLQQMLSKLLVRRISEFLSDDMRTKIDHQREHYTAALKMYGDGKKVVDEQATLEDAIVTFSRLFSETITGNAKDLNKIKPLIDKSNYEILFTDFPKKLQSLKDAPIFPDSEIQKNIMIALGPKGQLSAPFNAFESMVRQYINITRDPCRTTAYDIKKGLSFTVEKCGNSLPPTIARFPLLTTSIIHNTLKYLDDRLNETYEKLENEIDMEWEYISINHPDFDKICENLKHDGEKNTIDSKRATGLQLDAADKNTADSKRFPANNKFESVRVRELLENDPTKFKKSMEAYIDIIYRNICAMVPKVIYYNMINQAKEKLEGHLRSYFRRVEDTSNLFDEPRDIIEKREEAFDGIRECEEAISVLADMRQYCSRRDG